MKTAFIRKTAIGLLSLICWIPFTSAQTSAQQFALEAGWESASSIELDTSSGKLVPQGEGEQLLYTNQTHPALLVGKSYFADQIVSFEYLAPQASLAGVLLQGNYQIELSSKSTSGTIAGGFNRNSEQAFEATPPLTAPVRDASEWQRVEIRFRTLRNDEASNKTSNSLILDLTLNGTIVQQNQQIEYYTEGAVREWEQASAPIAFRVHQGPFALRNIEINPANYDALEVDEAHGANDLDSFVDQVQVGKETFTAMGCIECHTTKKGDDSFKTGPPLYGLFQRTPRQREVVEPSSKARFQIDADRSYAFRSIRSPNDELAIAENGPNAGKPYLPVMAPYSEDLLSNQKVDAIWRYLATLNDGNAKGPAQVLVPHDGPAEYDPLADTMEILVTDRDRIQRGSMEQVSGRSIHVGQTDGINYTFDPRTLGIERIWQGGFLNADGEWKNRGGSGFKMGYDSKLIDLGSQGSLIVPLLPDGSKVDFSFKEAVFKDWDTIDASLHSAMDHLDQLKAIDAQFLGYSKDSKNPTASPVFNFRIGENTIGLQIDLSTEGTAKIHLSGELNTEQVFSFNAATLKSASVDTGEINADGQWTLPPSKPLQATLAGTISFASRAWRPDNADTPYLRQSLEIEDTQANLPGGYRSEQYLPPHDNRGRELLFEATGIAVAPDGTIVVGTRTSGIWRIQDGEWQLFAEGLFDCLGLVIEDESGLQIVAGQKPELTRIADKDGDGIADTFETLADQFSYHSNYHTYMHGPVRDDEGNYYFLLNLAHADQAIYKAAGAYMGTSGGYSGWAIKITPDGEFIPWASGLRSPAGLGIDSSNTLWYADNQGEFVGTSKLFMLKENKFYGHPAGLVDLPGRVPESPEIQWPEIGRGKERAVALFPHNRVANSPGHMTWDQTEGSFGPFQDQMFIGDQTQSKLLRVSTFQINGKTRGAVFPFADSLQSGLMRPVFLPDGSLLIGQTGRGWQAHGGKIASLQRIVWDGETLAPAILTASVDAEPANEIVLSFARALRASSGEKQLQESIEINSWTYRDAPDYGSPELHSIEHNITKVDIAADRKSIKLSLANAPRPTQDFLTARVYHITINVESHFDTSVPETLEAYITGE